MDMDKIVKISDGFGVDKTGKVWALPMKIAGNLPSSTQKDSSAKKITTARRPYIHITPLNLDKLTATLNDQSEQRKSEKHVCKQLFKVPKKKSPMKLIYQRRSSVGKKFGFSKPRITGVKKISKNLLDGSPLLDTGEEKKLCNQTVATTLKQTVLFPIKEKRQQNEDQNTENIKNLVSEDSPNSDSEFLQFEKELASARKFPKRNVPSPVTSVCSLLPNTKITTFVQKQAPGGNVLFNNILNLVREEIDDFNIWKQQTLEFEKRHKKRMSDILQLIGHVENKENKGSLITQGANLRKRALCKSLPENFTSQSPRTRHAMELYNNLRTNCAVLCTPQSDKTVNTFNNTVARSLSTTIQEQCLLLQETPKQC